MMRLSILVVALSLSLHAAENVKAVGAVAKANVKAVGAVAEANIKAIGAVDNTGSGEDITTALVIHYLASTLSGVGDENPISTWTDSSGEGNNATAVTTTRPTYEASLDGKQCVHFDGVDDFFTIVNSAEINITGNLTIAMWIHTGATSGVMYGGYNSGTAAGFAFGNGHGSAGMASFWSSAHGSWVSATSTFNSTTWRHIAIVLDGTTARFYLDGVANGTPTSAAPPSNTADKALGAIAGGGSGGQSNMHIRDPRVYSRALTAAQIGALFTLNAE